MCGFFGVSNFSRDEIDRANQARDSLAHRGPDSAGAWFDETVYLGHRRLSILDLSARGYQPMSNSAGTVMLTVNGEIYNFQMLRSVLSEKYEFRSGSDSEVLVHGYEEWGIDGLLSRIEGMFAFAIYDARLGKVFLARDRVGIKPLFYSTVGGRYAWASELKALSKFLGSGQLRTDFTAVYDFLTYLYIPAPKTRYEDVFKLEPGQILEIDLDSSTHRSRRYWDLEVGGNDDRRDIAVGRVREIVANSVREQMVSDVPVGFFLSGGVDSSVVVAEASQLGKSGINTYSIGFEESDREDTKFALQVADRFGTRHKQRELPIATVLGMIDRLPDWYDEPFADTSAFPTFKVAELAREDVKVVLTGDGGDEVFGGYGWYNRFRSEISRTTGRARRIRRLLTPIRSRHRKSLAGRIAGRLEFRLLDELELHTRLLGGLLKDQKQSYAAELGIPQEYDDYWHFRAFYRPELPLYARLQYLDFNTYLPGDILTKVDRATMAVSLEARVPLLATSLIEYVFSLEENVRHDAVAEKILLKKAFENSLPASLLQRRKQGFSIPAENYISRFVKPGQTKQEAILDSLFAPTAGAA